MILSKAGESYLIKKCWKISRKVFQILTYIGQERPNERYRNTAKDLLLPNTVSQKDEKPHTAGLDDTAIPPIKIKITEIYRLKESSIPQYRQPQCPPRLEKSVSKSGTDW